LVPRLHGGALPEFVGLGPRARSSGATFPGDGRHHGLRTICEPEYRFGGARLAVSERCALAFTARTRTRRRSSKAVRAALRNRVGCAQRRARHGESPRAATHRGMGRPRDQLGDPGHGFGRSAGPEHPDASAAATRGAAGRWNATGCTRRPNPGSARGPFISGSDADIVGEETTTWQK
jgi:hypothetical protein